MIRHAGRLLICSALLLILIPASAQQTTDEYVRGAKRHLPGQFAGYNVVVVIDFHDSSLDLDFLSLTPDVLRDQLGVTVVPTLAKARALDAAHGFDAVMIVGNALDSISGRDRAWLARFYKQHRVTGFIDIPFAEQQNALKRPCNWQGVNDYPWEWVSVHLYEIVVTDQRTEALDAASDSCDSAAFKALRQHEFRPEWATVDSMNFHGGGYYAFGFVRFALGTVHNDPD